MTYWQIVLIFVFIPHEVANNNRITLRHHNDNYSTLVVILYSSSYSKEGRSLVAKVALYVVYMYDESRTKLKQNFKLQTIVL